MAQMVALLVGKPLLELWAVAKQVHLQPPEEMSLHHGKDRVLLQPLKEAVTHHREETTIITPHRKEELRVTPSRVEVRAIINLEEVQTASQGIQIVSKGEATVINPEGAQAINSKAPATAIAIQSITQ